MKLKHLVIASVAALLAAHVAFAADTQDAGEAQIIRNVAPLLKDLPIEKVTPSGHALLYELLTPQGIVYTDKAGSFVIFGGAMIDTKTRVNLTEKRVDEMINHKFSDFPLKDAIKVVRGNGSRVVITFEDPNCGYCKKLMQEMNKLDNVTVYTFIIPILSPDSEVKAKEIWCSPSPAKTWTEYMASNEALPSNVPANCEVPFERNLALQRKLHVNGTPALYFKDNTSVKGYVTSSVLETKLR